MASPEPNWRELVGYKSYDELLATFRNAIGEDGRTRLTNWNVGGVTRTFFELASAALERVYNLSATVVKQGFAPWSTDAWLDEHLRSIGTERAVARAAQGTLSVTCSTATTLRPGHTFATPPNTQGQVYRFNVRAETACGVGANGVPVEALGAGSAWNVAPGTITVRENVPAGVTAVTNGADWLTREGTNTESNERAQRRYAAEWTDPAGEILEQYESWALEADPAVVLARASQVRGPGSVDVLILTGEGAPSDELLETVDAYIADRKLLCRDVLVRGPTEVVVDVTAVVWLGPDATAAADAVQSAAIARAQAVFTPDPDIEDVVALGIGRSVYLTGELLDALKGSAAGVKKVTFTSPSDDVAITGDQIAVLGEIDVTVQSLRVLDDGSWAE